MLKVINKYYGQFRLFPMLFTLTVTLIVSVTLSVTWTTIRMAENFFIRTYSVQNTNVMTQIMRNFESFNDSMILGMDQIQRNANLEPILVEDHAHRELMGHLFTVSQQVKRAKSSLGTYHVDMIVIGNQGFMYANDSTYWPISQVELESSELLTKTKSFPKHIHYQFYDSNELQGNTSYIIISQALMNRVSHEQYGTILIPVKAEEFQKLYDAHISEGNHIYLVNREGQILSSDRREEMGQQMPKFEPLVEALNEDKATYVEKTMAGKKQVVMMEHIPYLDLYLFNVVDRNLVLRGLVDRETVFLTTLAIATIFLGVAFLIIKKLTYALSVFTEAVSNSAASKFKERVLVLGTYETREIARTFNDMLDELQVYLSELMEVQQQKREAELVALQRQINVHFLYNTLATIKFLTQQGKKEEATAMIHSLILLLQFTLGDMDEVTTIKKEIEALEHYVKINQRRYGKNIKVHFFVTPDTSDCEIPKLILQPFVENAFFHGFQQKKEGDIQIFIWSENNQLICEVMDNGDGFNLDAVQNSKERKAFFSGVGISNVKERIQLLYGADYGIKMESTPNQGTLIRVVIPLSRSNSSEDKI